MENGVDGFRQRLSEFYDDEEIEQWLSSPNELLGGCSAIELINRGDSEIVDEALSRLEDMTYL